MDSGKYTRIPLSEFNRKSKATHNLVYQQAYHHQTALVNSVYYFSFFNCAELLFGNLRFKK